MEHARGWHIRTRASTTSTCEHVVCWTSVLVRAAGLAQPGKSGTTLCFDNDRGLSPVWPNSSCARSTLVAALPDSPSAHPGSRA